MAQHQRLSHLGIPYPPFFQPVQVRAADANRCYAQQYFTELGLRYRFGAQAQFSDIM
jgi:hypothetical protein